MKLNTSMILQLKAFHVEHFKIEENVNGISKFMLDADFSPIKAVKKLDGSQHKGIIFTLKVNRRVKNPALRVEAKITAVFDIDKSIPEERQVRLMLYNGLSILYGIIRGMVFQSCSILPPSMRLLPTVNVEEFVKMKLQQRQKSGTTQ